MQGKILLVEDIDVVRNYVTELIKCAYPNLIIDYAETGDHAWRLLEAEKREFDLVLTDLEMPGMNGIELTAIIKKNIPNVPVILMSHVPPNEHCADRFVEKPVLPHTLLPVMRELLVI